MGFDKNVTIILVFLIIFLIGFMKANETLMKSEETYDYILPTRKVVSCPSFASFRFSCQSYHVISIDSLTFSPVLLDSAGECTSDWSSECKDEYSALEYAMSECSGKESCTLFSYQLRSRTKCNFHQVISVEYKCIPTWEVTAVPVKCDICKNVTINCNNDNFGFVHSAWYPKLYPRATCHSIIENKPDHIVVVYSVSGSIGLDRIQLQSLDHNGKIVHKEVLTGNLSTQLVLKSNHDVNVTVLPEDNYYSAQRRFLLYFYIVPKCFLILCPNMTVDSNPSAFIKHTSAPTTTACDTTYTTIRTTTTTTKQTDPPNSSKYDSRIHEHQQSSSKISDAWLAAILALVYAILMIFGVVAAIYCRRKRKRNNLIERKIIITPSINSNQTMNSSSRATSNMSNCEKQIISNMNTQKSIYHIPFNSIYLSNNKSYNENYNLNFEETMKRQSNYAVITPNSEFDHYSQVVAEVDDYTTNNLYEVQQRQDCYNDYRYSNVIGETYPYMLKTNNYYGSNITSSNDVHNVNNNNNESLKNIYRAVEYTKSSEGERVRVQNSENFNSATTNNIMELSEITQEIQTRNILLEEEEQVEKTFVVKLFPMDENLKEVQEMSLFYEK